MDNSKSLKGGFARTFTHDKLQAFQTGTMGVVNPTSKRAQEEIKKKQEEIATAEIYKEFVSSFSEKDKIGKAFVRGEVVNAQPDKISAVTTNKTGQLYKPTSKFLEQPPKDVPKIEKVLAKKKDKEKKKSNLELFKEELQKIQEEREERNRLKQELRESINKGGKVDPAIEYWLANKDEDYMSPLIGGSIPSGPGMSEIWDNDPTTTNIFLANLNPKANEEMLCDMFGEFGPLASVKIMWPRTEEEITRNRNCGFVAYMNRKDGERAVEKLQGVDLMGFEMKLGWGKPVPIPPHPIYIPPHLLELTMPPPPSGLPFNAQPPKLAKSSIRHRDDSDDDQNDHGEISGDEQTIDDRDLFTPAPGLPMPPTDPIQREKFDKTIRKSVVRVVIPTERPLLCLIHRMIEFVIREGPRFEAMIMNRELKNPMFRFLFDNKSPAHVYYRWKLFSILNGDTPTEWSTKRFRLFKGGSYWQPPPLNVFLTTPTPIIPTLPKAPGLVGGLVSPTIPVPHERRLKDEEGKREVKNLLSQRQRDRLENMLRKLTTEREKVCDAMIFCVDHADAAHEIVECLHQSLSLPQTPLVKKLARIYLISDILYNCSSKAPNVSYLRRSFQRKLPAIFKDIYTTYKDIKARLKAELFKQRIINCLKIWEEWDIYPSDFIIKLQSIFLGLDTDISEASASNILYKKYQEPLLSLINNGQNSFAGGDGNFQLSDAQAFGIPFGQLNSLYDDIDGAPLEINAMKLAAANQLSIYEDIESENETEDKTNNNYNNNADDIDGMPLKEETLYGGGLFSQPEKPSGSFLKSKWEEVDEVTLQSQAMTTSKWETLEEPEKYDTEIQNSPESSEPDYDTRVPGSLLAASGRPSGTSSLFPTSTTPNTLESPSTTPRKDKKVAASATTSRDRKTSTTLKNDNRSSDKTAPSKTSSSKDGGSGGSKSSSRHHRSHREGSKSKASTASSSAINVTSTRKRVVDYDDDDAGESPPTTQKSSHKESASKTSSTSHSNEKKEEKRVKLREIEMRVMKYQDELETGKASKKSGMSISDQVENYRNKLMISDDKHATKKSHHDDKCTDNRKRRSTSSSSQHHKSKKSKSEHRKDVRKDPKDEKSGRERDREKDRRSDLSKKHQKSTK